MKNVIFAVLFIFLIMLIAILLNNVEKIKKNKTYKKIKSLIKKNIVIIISIIISIFVLVYLIKENAWKTKFSVSNPQFIEDGNTIKFDVQNKTNNDYNVYIWYTATSGSLKEKTICIYSLSEENPGLYQIPANSTTTLKCSAWNFDDTYKVKINKIEIKNRTN